MNVKKFFGIIVLLSALFSMVWFTIKWWWFLPVLIIVSFAIQVIDKVIKIKNDDREDIPNSDGNPE
jgi:1,4-dihydroxy-2-naphthoate octaprenyltransferase